jgi:hypothetical protein
MGQNDAWPLASTRLQYVGRPFPKLQDQYCHKESQAPSADMLESRSAISYRQPVLNRWLTRKRYDLCRTLTLAWFVNVGYTKVIKSPPVDCVAVSTQTLSLFVSELASTAVSPGSGAAAALALALAAGCAAKAFAISQRHNASAALREAADRARAIATVALEGAQRDADDFRAWLKAQTSSAVRSLENDTHLLLEMASELEQLISEHRNDVIDPLISDLAAAADFVAAFKAIETRNWGELHRS